MGLYLKYIVGVLHLLLFNKTSSVTLHETWSLQNVRVKRQEGYVYDRPSVSFDLPTQPTTAATQAPVIQRTQTPEVDRTQSQYMYYAYPAPSGGDTVNIGYSTGNAAGTLAAGGGGGGENGGSAGGGGNGGAGGYNYGTPNSGTSVTQSASTISSSGGAGGYNYGTQNSGTSTSQTVSKGSASGGAGGYNYGTQNSGISATQTASTGAGYSGYNSNTPGPTIGTNQSPTTASTNAPKYLPPVSSGGVTTGVTVNIPSGPASSPAPMISSTGGSQTGISDSGYLPPLLSPSSSAILQPGSTPSSSPKPLTDTPSGYLPPAVSTPGPLPTQNTVSTPASTYLPPVF